MMSRMSSVVASFVSLVVAVLSGLTFANERVVFQCDFDQATAQGTEEGRIVVGFEGSRSLLIERSD